MSRRNKENRSQLRTTHKAGTRSYAQYRAAAQAQDLDGQEPDRMKMYHMMHVRRDGTFVDQASADFYTQMDELVSQHPEGTIPESLHGFFLEIK
ncbi:hypothetical protein HHK36_033427 [Tetracentron sinense]|uniref:Uncharacterized protein n=1 Tax=Tetracentron sinense TaxID=13715 RepID=A0A835CW45_TETSI|nr:hypothetical protein HHK36_033427 [Tetracentron sinense]